jgi:long-subunit fatty acid transport protein
MKKIILTIVCLVVYFIGHAQSASDALRYTYLPPITGTARTLAIGGAIGALGADFSAISINPAGIAQYRGSEFVITPGFFHASTQATLRSTGNSNLPANDRYDKLNISNIGAVFVTRNDNPESNWKTSNFAIGYNKIASIGQNMFYDGNSTNSIMNNFKESVKINGLTPFSTQLAFEAGALFKDSITGKYNSDFDNINEKNFKSQSINRTGNIGELAFNYAANYKDKISIGFTLGVPLLSFEEAKIYSESDAYNTIKFFNTLKYEEKLITEGAGLNIKAGIIYRANQMLRIGLAYHSPTFYAMTDQYNSSFTYNFTGGDGKIYNDVSASPEGQFNYKLFTPSKFIGSVGVIIGKNGFISSDIEYTDYSASNFSFEGDNKTTEREINADIQNRFKSTLNIRLGGELAFDVFRFRGGLGITPSAYLGDNNTNMSYSMGFGIRGRNTFVDFGYRIDKKSQIYKPYNNIVDKSSETLVDEKLSANNFVLTVGFKF